MIAPLATGYLSFEYLAPLGVDALLFMALAASLNLINGCAGLFSLGHQGFFGIGAYAGGMFVNFFVAAIGPAMGLVAMDAASGDIVRGGAFHVLAPSLGVPVLAASIVAGGLAAALFGLLVGLPCLRLKGDYLAIATLGFAEIFRIATKQIEIVLPRGDASVEIVGGSRGLKVHWFPLFDRGSDETRFYLLYLGLAALLVIASLVLLRNLLRSSHGRAIYAIRDDEIAAELLGVDLTRYKVTVFVLGAGIAGLAGGIYANVKPLVAPDDFDMFHGVMILLFVVLGGLGSFAGSIIASFGLFFLERALATGAFGLLPDASADWVNDWRQVLYAALLVILILLRPRGLFGKRSR